MVRTPRCLLDGDPYKPPTLGIAPPTLNPPYSFLHAQRNLRCWVEHWAMNPWCEHHILLPKTTVDSSSMFEGTVEVCSYQSDRPQIRVGCFWKKQPESSPNDAPAVRQAGGAGAGLWLMLGWSEEIDGLLINKTLMTHTMNGFTSPHVSALDWSNIKTPQMNRFLHLLFVFQ